MCVYVCTVCSALRPKKFTDRILGNDVEFSWRPRDVCSVRWPKPSSCYKLLHNSFGSNNCHLLLTTSLFLSHTHTHTLHTHTHTHQYTYTHANMHMPDTQT